MKTAGGLLACWALAMQGSSNQIMQTPVMSLVGPHFWVSISCRKMFIACQKFETYFGESIFTIQPLAKWTCMTCDSNGHSRKKRTEDKSVWSSKYGSTQNLGAGKSKKMLEETDSAYLD